MAARKSTKHARARAAKGGEARARALPAAKRSAIAKKAAEERWATVKGLPTETHSGILKLGDGIPCSVLDNGMRVFSVNGLHRAFESKAKSRGELEEGGTRVPSVLAAANIRQFISPDLMRQLESPVPYRSKHGGRTALGYEATIIRRMCDTLLDARAAGVLRLTQLPVARAAEGLVRAFADVGIVALIDEATGYQAERNKDDLARLLKAYVVAEMQPWVDKFPLEFFKQIHRLWGWPMHDNSPKGPRYVGKIINDIIYGRMVPNLPEKLAEVNKERRPSGRRKHPHYKHLTGDTGIPHLDKQIASVTTLMAVSDDKPMFEMLLKKRFPKLGDQLLMAPVVLPSESESPSHHEGHASGGGGAVATLGGVAMVDGVEVSDAVGGVRERITAAMRGRDMINSKELAKLVYNDDSEPTMNKLRIRLAQYKAQGLVETPRRGFWRLR